MPSSGKNWPGGNANAERRIVKQVMPAHGNRAGDAVLLQPDLIIYNYLRISILVTVFLKYLYIYEKSYCFIVILPIL